MPPRFLEQLSRLGSSKSEPAAPAAPPAATAAAPPAAPAAADTGGATPQAIEALRLAQELVHGLEQFVLSTPDLDAPRFLDRLRRTAAQLVPAVDLATLETHRQWATESLPAFGQLQRRYLSDREDELWRLIAIYQDHMKIEGTANNQFNENLTGVHERMQDAIRLDDLRQVRERVESEIKRASNLVEEKGKVDQERSAALAARVQQLEQALATARHEAVRDALTGVFHRGGFEPQLEAALEGPNPCTLAMMDIDNFKGINDTLGHLVGDEVLKFAVQVLGKIVRPGEIIGRFGGDEFCILAPGVTPQRLADRLSSVTQPKTLNFQMEGRWGSARLSMSVGVAGSQEGDTASALLRRADEALYDAKRGGKAKVSVAPVSEPVSA